MDEYVNPPCISSLATSFIIKNNEYNRRRSREHIPFGGNVASDERELAIDLGVSGSSAVPNLQFVPDLNVFVREGEECVRRALGEVEASDGRTKEASEEDSFVDIMVGLEEEAGGESEGFTFADFLQRADLLSETVVEGVVDAPDLPLC